MLDDEGDNQKEFVQAVCAPEADLARSPLEGVHLKEEHSLDKGKNRGVRAK